MRYRGFGCPRAPTQLFMESIAGPGPTTFRPTSSVAKLSALGDDFPPDCLLAGIRQSPIPSPRAPTALEDKEKLAHPTRFERVTFAFGGQASTPQSRNNAFNQSQEWVLRAPGQPRHSVPPYPALRCLAKLRYGSFMTSTADRN